MSSLIFLSHSFSITVQSVHFPAVKEKDLTEGVPVSVCFERGGKMVSSQDHPATPAAHTTNNQGSRSKNLVTEINETLRLVATLYRTGTNLNVYQEKSGKLVVRQKRLGDKPKGSNAYKGIGTAKLQLHILARTFEPSKMTLALEQCSTPGVVANVVVTAKVLGDCDDDTMSQMSGTSDISCGAADFGEAALFTAAAAESPLDGITEETDVDVLGDSVHNSDMSERPSVIFERILQSADASQIGTGSPLLRTSERNAAVDTTDNQSEPQKTASAMGRAAPEDDQGRDSEGRGTFSMQSGMPFISQAAYDDKIKEIHKLRNQLDQYTGDLSKTESKLATANMLVNAETKRSKKLKDELMEAKKVQAEFTHKIGVHERSKSLQEEKIKALEKDNERMKLMLATQRHLTEAVSERHEESRGVLKDICDQKVELVTVQDELNDVKNDRDVYKSELEHTREELTYLRNDLASRGIGIPSPEGRYEEDKDDMISALRSQLGSLQVLAEEDKAELTRKLEGSEAKVEKVMVLAAAREAELKKAGVQALAVAKEAWDVERRDLEIRLNSAETDIREMIPEIEQLRARVADSDHRIEELVAEAERTPSPVPAPTKSTDGPAPMLRQLSKMKSITASLTGSTKHLPVGNDSEEHQRQIEALTVTHNNYVAILTKELDSLRAKLSYLESELDSADQRFATIENELKLTKLELWDTLDKVENSRASQQAPEKRESLRTSIGSMHPVDASSALLEELISLKMEYATLANSRDTERLETFDLKKRVQVYAQRVANLEVQVALAGEQSNSLQ